MARKKPLSLDGAGAGCKNDYTVNQTKSQEESEFDGTIFAPDGAASDQEKFTKIFEETKKRITAIDFIWPEFEDVFADGRQRAWWFILYPESMNPDTFKILSEKGIQAAISPLHDRDIWPDGTPKKAHFHVIIYAPGKTTKKQLESLMKILGGVMLQPIMNIVGAARYLAHLDIQPDKVEQDRGKVRYSVDDIITFNGFDIMSYIKATQTQISQALKELYAIIDELNITSYWMFIRHIYDNKPEYEFVMANPHVCNQIDRAIRSRYALIHKQEKSYQQEHIIEEQRKQIITLLGGLDKLMFALEKMGVKVN